MSRSTSAGLAGLGGGLLVGSALASPAFTYVGAALLFVGVMMALVGGHYHRAPPRRPATAVPPPRLDGLGDRVQQILRLAEEQAEENRAEARRVLEEARSEARRIVDGARTDPTGP